MSDPQVNWVGGPAPLVSDQLPPRVFVVPAGDVAFIRLLAEPQPVLVHWVIYPDLRPQGRTRPCLRQGCEHCQTANPQLLYAYAAALRWVRDLKANQQQGGSGGRWDRVVACIPTEGWCDLYAQMVKSVASCSDLRWRGSVIKMERPGKANNSRVFVTLLEKQFTDPLPEAFDVRPELLRVWRVGQHVRWTAPAADQGEPADDGIIPFRRKGGA